MIEIDDKAFVSALNKVASTDEGKIVLAMLKSVCQWDMTYLASDSAEASHFYAVKRGVYGGIRQHIRPEFLKIIEFDYIRKVATNERTSSITTPVPRTRRGTTKPAITGSAK